MGYLTDGEVEERSDKDAAVQMLLDACPHPSIRPLN